MKPKHRVHLTPPQREQLRRRIAAGRGSAREVTHADGAVRRKAPDRVYVRKLDREQEAHLIALSCSEPPSGRAQWSMRLLAERLVELRIVEAVSDETVRRTLQKMRSSRG